jgi:hypothetical protein
MTLRMQEWFLLWESKDAKEFGSKTHQAEGQNRFHRVVFLGIPFLSIRESPMKT